MGRSGTSVTSPNQTIHNSPHYPRSKFFKSLQVVSALRPPGQKEKESKLTFQTGNSSSIREHYNTSAPQLPYYYYAIFDANLDLEKSIDCGLIAFREMPAIGSSSFTVTPTHYDDSVLKVLPRNTTNADCMTLPRTYYQFEATVDSVGVYNYSVCDADTSQPCISQILVRYSTFNLQRFTTMQGLSAWDILTNEGGIVGGVAFLCWYFGIWDILWFELKS